MRHIRQSCDVPDIARTLAGIADHNRLKLLTLIVDGEITFAELLRRSGIESSVLKGHLNALCKLDLIKTCKSQDPASYEPSSNKARQLLDSIFAYLAHQHADADTGRSMN